MTHTRGNGRELHRTLVAICRRTPPHDLAVRLDEIGTTEGLSALVDLASRHHVRGIVLVALDAAGILGRSDEALSRRLAALRRRAALFRWETLRAYRQLEEEGAEPVILKGSALQAFCYKEPVERDLADIDILVRFDKVFDSVRALESIGYRFTLSPAAFDSYLQSHFHVPMTHPLGCTIEVHWNLVKPRSSFLLDPEAVRSRAHLDGSAEEPLRVPAAEHMVLHLVIQNVHEGFSRLSRLVDVDRILASRARLDHDELVARAESGRLGPSTALTLQLARGLLATEISPRLQARLRPDSVTRCHIVLLDPIDSLLRQRSTGHPTWYRLLRFWLLPPWSPRRAMVLDCLRGRRDDEPWDDSPPVPARTSRLRGAGELCKLFACQVWSYFAGLSRQRTPSGREGMRFWSSQASSSDRL